VKHQREVGTGYFDAGDHHDREGGLDRRAQGSRPRTSSSSTRSTAEPASDRCVQRPAGLGPRGAFRSGQRRGR
jgi:hypothetical protein